MSNARKLGNMTTHGLDGDFNVDPTDNTLVVDSTNNRVGIGSATPTTTLDITGTATATAFAGPLTGNVTGTTSSISNHNTDALTEGSTNLYFTNARADARAQLKIDALVDSAPNTLDTLNELAAALGDDANFSTTVTNSIAAKLPLAGGSMTGALIVAAGDNGLDVRVGTDKRILFAGNIGEIGSVAGFQAVNTAGNANTAFGIRATDIRFATGSDERVRITDTGVGIGTDNPARKLHVLSDTVGDVAAFEGTNNGIVIQGHSSDANIVEIVGYKQSDATYADVHIRANTAGLIVKEATGNVGIGTTNPVGKLEVNAGTGNTFRAIRYSDNLMEIGNYNASDGYRATFYGSSEHRFMTATAGAGSGSVDMTITGSNVGIGTTSPAYKLDVFNNTTDTGSQLRVKNAYTTINSDAVVNIDGYGASTLKLWRNGTEEWKLERITNSDNLGLYAYGGAVSGGAGAGLIQFWDYDTGGIGFGTDSPGSRLEIYDSHGGTTGHSTYGHPVSGGSNGALYISKPNSRFDWDDGLVFCGEGTSWSARFTGRDGLTTNSDTTGEILGVHPVEGSATASWSDTAGASAVTSAFLRVMGNGKTFVKKLIAENTFIAPSHTNDTTANSAGGNVAGSIYYNTGSGVHRSYNGTYWANIGVAPITESTFDAFGDGSAICLLKANNSNLDTGGTHNASLVGGVTYTTTSKFGSHSFNTMGNGTYFDIASLPMVEAVSFWYHCVGSDRGYLVDFRHDAPGNGRSYLYTHSGGGSQNINMGNDTTTTNRTGVIYIDGVQFTSGQYNFNSSVWYHICIVRNATDTHRTWDQGLRFGNRSDGTTEGNAGYFDQIRVFNRQISAAEALLLYNEIA